MAMAHRTVTGGALTFFGLAAAAFAAPIAQEEAALRFGVMSDMHIGAKPDAVAAIEKALRWFASENVDAVLCPGDIAHTGLISEIETFAEVWRRVFPDGCAQDGRKVELMISTGNHDIDAYAGRWANFSEEQLCAQRFNYGDNPERTWRRLFDQEWALVWRREVKGYTFVGAQWSSLNPPIEAFMRENAATIDPSRPFFYCQHAHPRGTCHGGYAADLEGEDDGASVRILSAFPNAVAITGHSHCAIADDRTVWQGAFTSIGAGCTHEGAGGFNYDNVSAFWHPSHKRHLMASLADPRPWGGDAKGGGCELVEVFADNLVVHRRSIEFGRPVGPPWTVPIPARDGGPLDFGRQKAWREANGAIPQFDADARVEAEFCPDGHPLESAPHRGEACIHVSFPRARTVRGSRVFDYTVEACAEGGTPVTRKLVAAGFAYPEEDADIPGDCLFSLEELPTGKPIRFTVTPRDCFGLAGRPLVGWYSPPAAEARHQVEVRVRQTPGGPQIHVDGRPVSPHMFWGRETMMRLPVSGDWRHISIDYTPAVDVEKPRLRLQCSPRPGALEVRDLSFGTCADDSFTIEPDASGKPHERILWPGRFPKGVTQRLSFDVRATSLDWVRPCVEQADNGPYNYFAVEIPPDDPELLTLVAQARKARAAGVRFVSFYVPSCWMPEGEENWEPIDRIFRELVAVSPDILLVPRVTLNAPAWWTALHPEARMVMEDGAVSSYASVASRLYRREACAYVGKLVRHLMETFPRNFAGIHPTGQNTNEWFYWDSWSRLCGYDPATRDAFREWLAAHGDPDAATADVPPVGERKPQAPASCLLDPVGEADVLAFNRYLQDEMCDFVAEVAKTCRAASDGRKLVVLFFGYGWELSAFSHGPAASGHFALGRLLDEAGDAIDILAAPNSYLPDRGWLGSTPQMAPVETIMRRGILWVAEDDTRTYVDLDFLPPGAKPMYAGLSTQAETRDVFRRNLAQQTVRGTGSWWMDLFGRGWMDDAALWDIVRDFRAADAKALARSTPYRPVVAHILDEESMIVLAARSKVGVLLFGNARPAFARTGASCGQYLLSDVLRNPPDAPLQILPVWYADERKAAALASLRERQPAATRVWCWAPAFLGPNGGNLARMKQVTGFSFTRLPKGGRRVVSTADGVAAGLPAEWGGTIANDVDPRFAAETRPGDEVWAAWPDGGAAVVLRPHSGGVGHEVFCGTPELPQHLLAALARKSGARLLTETPERTIALASDRLLSIQALEDGEHLLDVGTEGSVFDALTGEVIGNGPRLTLTLHAGEARLLAW